MLDSSMSLSTALLTVLYTFDHPKWSPIVRETLSTTHRQNRNILDLQQLLLEHRLLTRLQLLHSQFTES